jgi:hypothetical protein
MQHIREAEALSQELGGTDKDVKEYFFKLSPAALRMILDEYGRAYGADKREYAEETIPAWRSGARQMSGLVASRLFKLLPRHMPLERKYAMIETLWAKHAPQSEYSISFGRNSNPKEIHAAIEKHMLETVNGHTLPEPLQRRFQWLASGDTQVMQELLNHFLLRDQQQAIEAVAAEVTVLLRAAACGEAIQSFRRETKVGGHTIHVFLDPRATTVSLARGGPRFKSRPDYSWIGGLIVIAVIIAWIWLGSHRSSDDGPQKTGPSQYNKTIEPAVKRGR